MIVYVDILLLVNLIVNFYLLLFSAKLGAQKARFRRLLPASLFGAAAAFSIFLPDLGFLLSAALRLAISGVTVLICFGFGTIKRFLRLMATFFISTFAFAGLMLALWHLLHVKSMVIRNSVVYYDISPLLLIASTVAAYIVLTVIRKLIRKNASSPADTYGVTVCLCGVQARFNALLDTGNALADPFSDAPVIVAEYDLVAELLPKGAREIFASGEIGEVPQGLEQRYRLIPFAAVGGGGMLPGFKADYAEVCAVNFGRCDGAVVAVSASSLGGEHRALIGASLLERCAGEKSALSYTGGDGAPPPAEKQRGKIKIFK